MTRELLDVLVKYNAEVLNTDRIRNQLKINKWYQVVALNLILNRDEFSGVSSEDIESCKSIWLPIIPVIKPYYKKIIQIMM